MQHVNIMKTWKDNAVSYKSLTMFSFNCFHFPNLAHRHRIPNQFFMLNKFDCSTVQCMWESCQPQYTHGAVGIKKKTVA